MKYLNKLKDYGLIDIQSSIPEIAVDLKYNSSDNFVGFPVYCGLNKAFAVKELVDGISKAQNALKKINDSLTLLIWDAARPQSVQEVFYNSVKGTEFEAYIASPKNEMGLAGFHNYGMAIDATISSTSGKILDMGSSFDSFTEISHSGIEHRLYEQGILTQEAYHNRMLLYYVMSCGGLSPHPLEWWHFQIHHQESDKLNFKLLDF